MNFKLFLAPTKNVNPFPLRQKITSLPYFLDAAEQIANSLKNRSAEDLSKMMKISTEIAVLNKDRYCNWKKSSGKKEEYHAIQMYSGEAFKAFDFQTLDQSFHEKLQNSLFILSGLYGVLKPFDLVYPYRLEMGLSYSPATEYKNLYTFWGERISDYLNKTIEKDDLIINLASKEYSNVIDFKALGRRVITPHFKEFKNGKYNMVMMFAKNARGKMARFLIENDMQEVENLLSYSVDGYTFNASLSTESDWVFVR